MTVYETWAIIISILSLLVSVITGIISINKSNHSNKMAQAANSIANKANDISEENKKIAQGQIELYINQLITQTKKDVMDISLKVSESSNNTEQKNNLLLHALHSAIEINLNAYEEACAKYIDGKVDKERFKKNYMVAIRQQVESPDNADKFNATTSPYKAILKVYKEWNDFENV